MAACARKRAVLREEQQRRLSNFQTLPYRTLCHASSVPVPADSATLRSNQVDTRMRSAIRLTNLRCAAVRGCSQTRRVDANLKQSAAKTQESPPSPLV